MSFERIVSMPDSEHVVISEVKLICKVCNKELSELSLDKGDITHELSIPHIIRCFLDLAVTYTEQACKLMEDDDE